MQAPSNYKTAGTLMMVSGIMSILTGLIIAFVMVFYVALPAVIMAFGTFGVSLLCLGCCLYPLLPMGFGVYELITGVSMMNGNAVRHASTVSIIGIVSASISLAFIPLILEIVATVMLNDEEVKGWLAMHDPELLQ